METAPVQTLNIVIWAKRAYLLKFIVSWGQWWAAWLCFQRRHSPGFGITGRFKKHWQSTSVSCQPWCYFFSYILSLLTLQSINVAHFPWVQVTSANPKLRSHYHSIYFLALWKLPKQDSIHLKAGLTSKYMSVHFSTFSSPKPKPKYYHLSPGKKSHFSFLIHLYVPFLEGVIFLCSMTLHCPATVRVSHVLSARNSFLSAPYSLKHYSLSRSQPKLSQDNLSRHHTFLGETF